MNSKTGNPIDFAAHYDFMIYINVDTERLEFSDLF